MSEADQTQPPISDAAAHAALDGLTCVRVCAATCLEEAERAILRLLDERHALKARVAELKEQVAWHGARAQVAWHGARAQPPEDTRTGVGNALRDLLAELPDPTWFQVPGRSWPNMTGTPHMATVKAAHAVLRSATTPAKETI